MNRETWRKAESLSHAMLAMMPTVVLLHLRDKDVMLSLYITGFVTTVSRCRESPSPFSLHV